MNKEAVYSIWAPEDSIWSRWAKPVLFAHLHMAPDVMPEPAVADVSWFPPADGKVALVLNLPAARGVSLAVTLAGRGFRPVPLYNAVPMPYGESIFDPVPTRRVAAVDVLPILGALEAGTEALAGTSLAPDAPPVFLLDSNRFGFGRYMNCREFDNRSVSFPTDFPSANFLAVQGVERVVLVQKYQFETQEDLAHTLRRWQEGGIRLERLWLDPSSPPEPFEIPRPSWFGAMFQRVLFQFGLRRSPTGGFGGWVPDSSSGG